MNRDSIIHLLVLVALLFSGIIHGFSLAIVIGILGILAAEYRHELLGKNKLHDVRYVTQQDLDELRDIVNSLSLKYGLTKDKQSR